MKTANVLQTMQEITEKYVKLYKSDFYDYDRPRIMRDRPAEFVWMIRETGTHIMMPRDSETETGENWRYRYNIFAGCNETLYYCTMRPDGSGTITRSAQKCEAFAQRQAR